MLCRLGRGSEIGVPAQVGTASSRCLSDIDRKRRLIVVRLKGARDERRVPVADDFLPVFECYVNDGRRAFPNERSLWMALCKGHGKPLTYASFESPLRHISLKDCVPVYSHLLQHSLAQGVLDLTGNLKTAQELLRHSQQSAYGLLLSRCVGKGWVVARFAGEAGRRAGIYLLILC